MSTIGRRQTGRTGCRAPGAIKGQRQPGQPVDEHFASNDQAKRMRGERQLFQRAVAVVVGEQAGSESMVASRRRPTARQAPVAQQIRLRTDAEQEQADDDDERTAPKRCRLRRRIASFRSRPITAKMIFQHRGLSQFQFARKVPAGMATSWCVVMTSQAAALQVGGR